MNVKFCLAFPREAVSVPVMRRVLGDTLRNLGVADDCVGDILVAVTEACTNVLMHSGTARRYEVVTSVGPGGCLVEVVDSGQGFGPRAAAAAQAGSTRGAHATRPRRAQTKQDPAGPKRPARQKDPLRGNGPAGAKNPVRAEGPPSGNERSAQRRGAVATAASPCGRVPSARQLEDQVIARLPESGRGLQIMRAMVDDVTLQSGPGRGTVVSMHKRVSLRRDAPLAGLWDRKLRDAG